MVFHKRKKPVRSSDAPIDTTITTQDKPIPTNPGLPTIELKEHTIIGERIISEIPESKKITDKSNTPIITANPTGEGKGNRDIVGAGGIKMDQPFFIQLPILTMNFIHLMVFIMMLIPVLN